MKSVSVETSQVKAVAVSPATGKPRLTQNQVRSFWAAWGGWTMDGMDSFIYSLVLVPALRELLPKSGILADHRECRLLRRAAVRAVHDRLGRGLIWGPIADRFGRVRTMMFSILCFSFFTLLAALFDRRLDARGVPFSCGGGHWRRVVDRRRAGVGRLARGAAYHGAAR